MKSLITLLLITISISVQAGPRNVWTYEKHVDEFDSKIFSTIASITLDRATNKFKADYVAVQCFIDGNTKEQQLVFAFDGGREMHNTNNEHTPIHVMFMAGKDTPKSIIGYSTNTDKSLVKVYPADYDQFSQIIAAFGWNFDQMPVRLYNEATGTQYTYKAPMTNFLESVTSVIKDCTV